MTNGGDMTDKAELIKIAAELAMCKNMPSPFFDDWNFPKYMSYKQRCMVVFEAAIAEHQCKEWAIRIREIADRI